jgi:pentatricopeptide repeat protein
MLRTVTRPAREGGARREFTEVEKLYRSGKEPWKQSPRAAALKNKEKKALTRQAPPTAPYRKSAVGVQSKTEQQHSSAAVKDRNKRKRELQYLADPLELAVFVKKELGKDRATEMVQLVQMASQTMRAVVGWNHIIDYYLAKGKVSHAINVYNDVSRSRCFPWACVDTYVDEEAPAVPRLVHLHDTPPRTLDQCA